MAPRSTDIPKICVINRTYGNRVGQGEGVRVKAGSRYGVADEIDDFPMLLCAQRGGSTREQRIARYKQLRDGRLAQAFDPAADLAAAPAKARYARKDGVVLDDGGEAVSVPADDDSKGVVTSKNGPLARSASRRRVPAVDPPAPKVIRQGKSQAGSQTGADDHASLSQEDQASGKSTSKKRGKRKG